jgi:hypothetical protein
MFNFNRDKFIGINASSSSKPTGQMQANISQSVVNNMFNTDYTIGVMDDFIGDSSASLRGINRDIYVYDGTSGPAADLMVNLPFSDCNLLGVSDPKVLDIYESSLNELGILQLMKKLSLDTLVQCPAIASLIFNSSKGIFTDVIMRDADDCEITPIPLLGHTPKIDLRLNQEFRKFLSSQDPRDLDAINEIPIEIRDQLMRGSKIQLEPLNTIYLTRTNVTGVRDISMYNRVVPIWLIEKALIRGTIIGSWRRQRSILHLMVGDDEWESTPEQLQEIANVFLMADKDPMNAVVATRPNVESNEIKGGKDFWNFIDDWDQLSTMKMRALGISDAFLSGEASYNQMEVALSVFIESLKMFRAEITQAVFYDKIFLLLAKRHKFIKRDTAELDHRIRKSTKENTKKEDIEKEADEEAEKTKEKLEESKKKGEGVESSVKIIQDFHKTKKTLTTRIKAAGASGDNKYIIPELSWVKQLEPKGDTEYMQLLDGIKEDIPLPLRMLASAGGVDMNKILEGLDDDINVRKQINDYKEKLKKINPEGGDDEEGGGDMWGKLLSNEPLQEKFVKTLANNFTDTMSNGDKGKVINLLAKKGKGFLKGNEEHPYGNVATN